MAILALRNMEFKVPLGYYEEERILGTDIEIDVVMNLLEKDEYVDSIDETINYEVVYSIVKEQISKECKLIEAAASRIMKALLAKYQGQAHFEVHLRKLRPPLNGPVGCAEIVISS